MEKGTTYVALVGGAPGGTGAVLVVNGPNSQVVFRP